MVIVDDGNIYNFKTENCPPEIIKALKKQEEITDTKKVFTPEQYKPMMMAEGYYFYALKNEISKGHEGQRVVIQNCRVIGYFNGLMEAIGYMADNGQRAGTFSVHECGECKNEMKISADCEVHNFEMGSDFELIPL